MSAQQQDHRLKQLEEENALLLEQSLASIDRQIAEERAKLTAATGGRINTSLEQFQQLQMAVDFHQEMYMSAMMAMEKGRFDATRMLDKVSVLQAPTLPSRSRLFCAFFVGAK